MRWKKRGCDDVEERLDRLRKIKVSVDVWNASPGLDFVYTGPGLRLFREPEFYVI